MELLHLIIAGLLFVVFLLSGLVYYLFKNNKELTDITETCFENEQRLANKLDNTYKALTNSNIWLEKLNADGSLGIIVKQNKDILKNNKPEQLEY
jgi:hypothetical protein